LKGLNTKTSGDARGRTGELRGRVEREHREGE
jgi:hypothetical protein